MSFNDIGVAYVPVKFSEGGVAYVPVTFSEGGVAYVYATFSDGGVVSVPTHQFQWRKHLFYLVIRGVTFVNQF